MINSIQTKLNHELVIRNARLVPPHVVVILIVAYLLRATGTFYPYVLILFSLFMRWALLKKFQRPTLPYIFFVSLTGLGWGMAYYYVHNHYGLYTPQTISVLGLIVILMSGGVTAFSCSLISCYGYFLSLASIPLYLFLTHEGDLSYMLGILLLGNLWYNVYHAHVSHNLMRKLYLAEYEAFQKIRELDKAKSDLRIQEARSQYTAKLVSLGEFSAGIAHEVNNPLTIIEGSVALMKVILEDATPDKNGLTRVANKISETTSRIAKIIKGLRTLSGNADEEPFTNVSFHSIVEPALEISRPKLQSYKIKISVHAPDDLIDLFGNEVQLSQVIMNLVSNAIDAVKDMDGDRWIEIHYSSCNEWIDIRVVDSGRGVGEEIRGKIMDPFFTTKESHQGTGLGLSISKTIVENHQGTLVHVPESPHTTFRMRFPRMNPWTKKTELAEESVSVP